MRVSINILNVLFSYAATRGFDRDRVLEASGLSNAALDATDERVPAQALYAVHRALNQLTHEDDWALSVADALPKGAYGIAEYIFRCQSSLLESLNAMVRYFSLLSDVTALALDPISSGVVLEARHVDPELRMGSVHRNLYQNLLSGLIHVAREITSPDLKPMRVLFPFAPPARRDVYTHVFGCQAEFGADTAQLWFDSESLASQVRAADPNLSRILQRCADELLQQGAGNDAFVVQVRRAIVRELHGGDTSLHAIARKMSTSNRSLQRKLAESGYTFKSLLDEMRYDAARHYLTNATLSIDEISFLLGYSDNSAFVKAFKRWGQLTPGEYRARHRGGATLQ